MCTENGSASSALDSYSGSNENFVLVVGAVYDRPGSRRETSRAVIDRPYRNRGHQGRSPWLVGFHATGGMLKITSTDPALWRCPPSRRLPPWAGHPGLRSSRQSRLPLH